MYHSKIKVIQRSNKRPLLFYSLLPIFFYLLFPVGGFCIRAVGDELLPNIEPNTLLWVAYTQETQLGDLVLVYTADPSVQCPMTWSVPVLYQLLTSPSCFAIRRIVGLPQHKYQVKYAKVIQDHILRTYQVDQNTTSQLSKNLKSNTNETTQNAKPINVTAWYEFLNEHSAYLIYLPLKADAFHLNLSEVSLQEDEYFVLCDHRIHCLSPEYSRSGTGVIKRSQIIGVIQSHLSIF
jgi:hypothetical protein